MEKIIEAEYQHAVVSANIAEIYYDDKTWDLELTFQNEAVYVYHYFPPYEFDRFVTSHSYGEFFNTYIKHDYDYEKLQHWIV